MVKHLGPKVFDHSHWESFVKKYEKTFIDEGKVYTLRERALLTPHDVMASIMNGKEGLGKNLKTLPYRILKDDEALSFLRDKEFEIYI